MNYHPYNTATNMTNTSIQATTTINHPTYFPQQQQQQHHHHHQNMTTLPTTGGNPIAYYTNGATPSVIVYSNNATDTTTIIDTYSLDTSNPMQQHNPSSDIILNHPHSHPSSSSLPFSSWHNSSLLHPMNHNNNHNNNNNNNFPLLTNDDDLCSPLPERGVAGFVCKLYQYLEDNDMNEKYARWCRHNGKDMFVIDCISKFSQKALPKLFKHNKFPSFVRQLNIYGFQRDTDARKSKDSRDKESCRWYHEYFRPERRDLFHLIRRRTPRYKRKRLPKVDLENESNQVSNDESDNENDDGSEQYSPSTSPEVANPSTSILYSPTTQDLNNFDFQHQHHQQQRLLDHTQTVISPSHLLSQQSFHQSHFQQNSLQNDHHSNHNNNNTNNNMIPVKIENQSELQTNLLIGNNNNNNNNNNNQNNNHNINNSINNDNNNNNSNNNHNHNINTNTNNNINTNSNNNNTNNNNNNNTNNNNNNNSTNNNNNNNDTHNNNSILMNFPNNSQTSYLTDSFEQNSTVYHSMLDHQHPHQQQKQGSISSSSTSTLVEEELKSQIFQLKQQHQQMYTCLTNELSQARKQIDFYRIKLENLQRSLQLNR
ncbi:unnamed protein product [Cunninghamella blakesleeana]